MKIDARKEIHLPDIVGKGYATFWNFKGRYRVVKGSRSSKKSKTTALNFIYRLEKHPEANLLVVRKTERTLKDSCYKELRWAINRLGVSANWKATLSPLQISNRRTGQVIYFRGMDDPLKITSITVDVGILCWVWIEEAYEITKEEDFDMINESIRGQAPDGLFKQLTLTFNPWNERHWMNARFFSSVSTPEALAITTNYLCNEFLDEADRTEFERMKERNPRRYQVAGLGNWGITEGLVYENWEESVFDIDLLLKEPGIRSVFGLDWGYTHDPSALFCGLVDQGKKLIYVHDEMYKSGMSNEAIAAEIKRMGYAKELIRADSAEPKSIDRLRQLGIIRITSARKGPDSIRNGIDALQDYKIIIHPRCVNFLLEIGNYTWKKDKLGKMTGQPDDNFNHLMDAMRYAVEDLLRPRLGFAPTLSSTRPTDRIFVR